MSAYYDGILGPLFVNKTNNNKKNKKYGAGGGSNSPRKKLGNSLRLKSQIYENKSKSECFVV